MQIAEVAEAGTELVDNAQARLRAFYLGDCDGAVQLDDGRAGQAKPLPLVSVSDRTAAQLSAWRMPALSSVVRGSVVQYRHG